MKEHGASITLQTVPMALHSSSFIVHWRRSRLCMARRLG